MKDLRMSLNAYFYFSQGYYYGAGYFACMKLSSPESRFAVSYRHCKFSNTEEKSVY